MSRLIKFLWGSMWFLIWATAICFIMAAFVASRPARELFPVLCVTLFAVGSLAGMLTWLRRSSNGRSAPQGDPAQIETLLVSLDRMERRMENLEAIFDVRHRAPSLDEEFARLKGEGR